MPKIKPRAEEDGTAAVATAVRLGVECGAKVLAAIDVFCVERDLRRKEGRPWSGKVFRSKRRDLLIVTEGLVDSAIGTLVQVIREVDEETAAFMLEVPVASLVLKLAELRGEAIRRSHE